MIDVVTQIKDDHRKVEELFRKFEDAHGKRDKQRIAEQIIEELSLHASVEEQLIYPLFRMRERGLEDQVLEALEEHHLAKTTLAELDSMTPDDERYDAKMTVLAEAIRHHIEEEESELLPRFEGLTSEEERARIAETIPRLKELAPNHPHPMAPDTPPKNLFGGLLAKVLDTATDLARLVIAPEKGRARMAAKSKRRGEVAKMRASSARSSSGSSPSRSSSSERETARGGPRSGAGSSARSKGGSSRGSGRTRGRVAAASSKSGRGKSTAGRARGATSSSSKSSGGAKAARSSRSRSSR